MSGGVQGGGDAPWSNARGAAGASGRTATASGIRRDGGTDIVCVCMLNTPHHFRPVCECVAAIPHHFRTDPDESGGEDGARTPSDPGPDQWPIRSVMMTACPTAVTH